MDDAGSQHTAQQVSHERQEEEQAPAQLVRVGAQHETDHGGRNGGAQRQVHDDGARLSLGLLLQLEVGVAAVGEARVRTFGAGRVGSRGVAELADGDAVIDVLLGQRPVDDESGGVGHQGRRAHPKPLPSPATAATPCTGESGPRGHKREKLAPRTSTTPDQF